MYQSILRTKKTAAIEGSVNTEKTVLKRKHENNESFSNAENKLTEINFL